ncbi:MAG TPA: hypothetical protein VGG74_30380 [Kofleriaceae bacterium]|jgi:hypothetical protein
MSDEEVDEKIEASPSAEREDENEEEVRKALSGLQKARTRETFVQDVTSTIHKRSAGRFFARRTFGDRVPFGALAIAAVLGLVVIAYLMWASQTGSLAPRHETAPAQHGSALQLAP